MTDASAQNRTAAANRPSVPCTVLVTFSKLHNDDSAVPLSMTSTDALV